MEDYNLIIEILEDILGDSQRHHPGKGQIAFDCPVCSYDIKGLDCGDGKSNLEVNYHMGVYSPLTDVSPHDLNAKQVWNYLRKRNISKQIVEKYKIGFTTEGEYKFRVIVPSYNIKEELQFFIARSYVNSKLKYKNPEQEKSNLIFNEGHIDWHKDIYLVEGVFDMFFVENSIPLLGKVVSDNLWQRLYEESKANIIICLDGDAWDDAVKLYEKINGGKLRGRIKIVKLPDNRDIADLKGEINPDNILELHK